jgi:hypothetical protein
MMSRPGDHTLGGDGTSAFGERRDRGHDSARARGADEFHAAGPGAGTMSAPRLVTRALVTSFLTVALVLGAVFAVLACACAIRSANPWPTTCRSSAAGVHARRSARQQDMRASVAILAENSDTESRPRYVADRAERRER